MFAIFFNHQWPVAIDVLSANNTITGSGYAETILLEVVQEISSQRAISITQNVLLLKEPPPKKKKKKIQVLLHPSYTMRLLALSALDRQTS